jgi:hypothetical protein
MKQCPKCGAQYEDEVNFCPMDATRLAKPQPKPPGSEVPVHGWTQALSTIDAKPPEPKTRPSEPKPEVAGLSVPVRGWTEALSTVPSPPAAEPTSAAPPATQNPVELRATEPMKVLVAEPPPAAAPAAAEPPRAAGPPRAAEPPRRRAVEKRDSDNKPLLDRLRDSRIALMMLGVILGAAAMSLVLYLFSHLHR